MSFDLMAGARVRAARTANSRTQADLASLLGLHPSAIAKVEDGSRPLSFREATVLAADLGVTLDYLAFTELPDTAPIVLAQQLLDSLRSNHEH